MILNIKKHSILIKSKLIAGTIILLEFENKRSLTWKFAQQGTIVLVKVVMNPEVEIYRLFDLMPASGRMGIKVFSKPEQEQVIYAPQPLPWSREKLIYINFDLWRYLSVPQQDLLFLSVVCRLLQIKWLQPNWYQVMAAAGLIGGWVEFNQGDAIGMIVGSGLALVGFRKLWEKNDSNQVSVEADQKALQVAARRNYTETEAAEALYQGIVQVAEIEKKRGLNFTELLRCQNLKSIAGIANRY
jgi:hypothetical protein